MNSTNIFHEILYDKWNNFRHDTQTDELMNFKQSFSWSRTKQTRDEESLVRELTLVSRPLKSHFLLMTEYQRNKKTSRDFARGNLYQYQVFSNLIFYQLLSTKLTEDKES